MARMKNEPASTTPKKNKKLNFHFKNEKLDISFWIAYKTSRENRIGVDCISNSRGSSGRRARQPPSSIITKKKKKNGLHHHNIICTPRHLNSNWNDSTMFQIRTFLSSRNISNFILKSLNCVTSNTFSSGTVPAG